MILESSNSELAERVYIQGIVSNSAKLEGTNQCDDKNYIVFTKVIAYAEWVQDIISSYDFDN